MGCQQANGVLLQTASEFVQFSKIPNEPLSADLLAVWVHFATVVVAWILSLLTGNLSQVDRLWSISPVIFMVILAKQDVLSAIQQTQVENPRLLVMVVLVSLWGSRLTYNFARKGGYHFTNEDYRWAAVRKLPFVRNPVGYHLFNLFFVHIGQMLLLLLILLPACVAFRTPSPLNVSDLLVTFLFMAFLVGETLADQQQWNFHKMKIAQQASGKSLSGDCAHGFLSSGLFQYSRHPNYFCEIPIWWTIYFFSGAATGCYVNVSIVGALCLVSLFMTSCWITEKLSASKYPMYKDYQQTTSMLIPWVPKRRKLE